MMTANDAYKILLKTFKEAEPTRCHETNSSYLFTSDSNGSTIMDNIFIVEKNTGECRVFMPTEMDDVEYDSAKLVPFKSIGD